MLRLVTSSAELTDAIDQVRRGAGGLTTSWFAALPQVEYWIRRRVLYRTDGLSALLIVRRDRNFYHLSHVASSREALSEALAEFGDQPDIHVADLVGFADDASALATLYQAHGFSEHRCLVRMVRLATDASAQNPADADIVVAGPPDVPAVYAFLDRLLDPFRDNIPELDELEDAAARGGILMVNRGAEPGGVLLFETTGFTSILRYWYVAADCRDQGVGARLIRAFFRLCAASKRIILWVDATNSSGIAKYEHYGFRRENLVDRIMIKGASKA
jgi:GNAT superfamily N-acetyltransferase